MCGNLKIWNPENLPTCAPRDLRRRSWRCSAAVPEWAPARHSRGGHGSPMGGPRAAPRARGKCVRRVRRREFVGSREQREGSRSAGPPFFHLFLFRASGAAFVRRTSTRLAARTSAAGPMKADPPQRASSARNASTVKMRMAGVRGNVPIAAAMPEPKALRSLRKLLIQVSPFSEILAAWPANHSAHLQMKSSRHSGAPDG